MDINKNRIISLDGDVFGHFILSALALMNNKGVEIGNPDTEQYNITLTINGVELPVEEVIMSWHDKIEGSVDRRVECLFNEKFSDVRDIYNDLVATISENMDAAKLKICSKMNIEYIPDGWE